MSRTAFLATTRAVIDMGGQRISAHAHLEDAPPITTLIVWGSTDRMIPVAHALTVERELPDCRVEVFDAAGHFPPGRPGPFRRLLRDFIAV